MVLYHLVTNYQHLKNSSILVLPSYHEGFSHIIWEAAVMKVPVIVTDVGGIKSLITGNDAYFINLSHLK